MQTRMLVGLWLLSWGGVVNAQQVRVDKVPHVRQSPDFCGEACLEMALRALGHAVTQDQVFGVSGLDPSLGRGCHTAELVQAAKRLGFDVGRVWNPIDPARPAVLGAVWSALLADLKQGTPSVVCMKYDSRPNTTEHFRLITGYDAKTDEVLYHEPAQARAAYKRMPRARLLRLWPLPSRDQGKGTAIRLRLKLATFKAPPVERGHTRAAFAQHVLALKKRLPHPRFTIVVQAPFVVVGDEAPARVRSRSIRTVKWAADRLKAKYFKRDPTEILDVWLFRDAKSYTTNAKRLFGSKPTTTFGYYSSADKALVMNIATGGGTLVHEIVHPFMAANFPGVPSWFNEGLASLYEQCGERTVKGRKQIWGYTNWRLKNLQRLIRKKRLPRFTALLKTTSRQFYDRDEGDNYAQARYLCYYLQDRGLLQRFFHRFQATRKQDPSGIAALQHVLGQTDLAAFQTTWEAWVLKLRFPS